MGLLLCVCASVSDIWGGLCVEGIVSVYNAFLRNVFVCEIFVCDICV